MPKEPPPGTTATASARYACRSVAAISRIACWNSCDMWLTARSVNTTEYSSRPSGSTPGN
jgi:hypothetical protein